MNLKPLIFTLVFIALVDNAISQNRNKLKVYKYDHSEPIPISKKEFLQLDSLAIEPDNSSPIIDTIHYTITISGGGKAPKYFQLWGTTKTLSLFSIKEHVQDRDTCFITIDLLNSKFKNFSPFAISVK